MRASSSAGRSSSLLLRHRSLFRTVLKVFVIWWLADAVIAQVIGPGLSNLVPFVVLLVVLVHPQWRRRLFDWLHLLFARRRFRRALLAMGISPLDERPPKITAVSTSPVGLVLHLQLQAGTSSAHLERLTDELATLLAAREVRVERDPANARFATLTVVYRDAFATKSASWPLARAAAWSFSRPVPVGIAESGNVTMCELVGHHLLIGGEPGAGKSNALSLVIGAAALDPRVRLHLLDGKLVELAPWVPCASSFVGPDLESAIELLDELRVSMDHRYEQLLLQGRRKVEPDDAEGFDVLVCDELALYLNGSDKKAIARFSDSFRDLVARGRAAGVVVVAATQKPSVDVIPSSIRDLFGYRWAMRCATRDASDTILGAGWASLEFSAADIDSANRGVGLLLHEGGLPERIRAFHLSDDEIAGVVGRATQVRSGVARRGQTK